MSDTDPERCELTILATAAVPGDCTPVAITTGMVPAGTYYFFAATDFFGAGADCNNLPEGNDYLVHLEVGPRFIRGDANNDGGVDIGDGIRILSFLFPHDPPLPPLPCREASNANDDAKVDIGDSIYIFGYLFQMGRMPPPPFPDCDLDPEPSRSLGCEASCP